MSDRYTILVNNDNTLTTSVKTRIMQRSNMVDKLHFLVEPIYNDYDMSKFTLTMEYVLPVSRKYRTEVLVLSEELYKNKLEYFLPVDTKITSEAGNVEFTLTFTYLEMDAEGNTVEHVRKTDTSIIQILSAAQWAEYIPSADLDSISQIMLSLQAKIEQEKVYAELLQESRADNIKLDEENGEIYLTVNGEKIGEAINLNHLGDALADVTEDGMVKIITDSEIEIPDNSDNGTTISYSLALNQESDELYLLANGKIVSTISTKDIGESITNSTEDGVVKVII